MPIRTQRKPRAFLERFQRESPHPISNEQLEAAESTDTVKGAGVHRDGYALLELTAAPGIWHEECLEWVEPEVAQNPISLKMPTAGVLSQIAFHEKAGLSQEIFGRRAATVAILPSALSMSDFFRSVQVGRSRFSRCCHIGDLDFISKDEVGPGDRRNHRNSALGFAFIADLQSRLRNCGDRMLAVVQRLVNLSADPEMM